MKEACDLGSSNRRRNLGRLRAARIPLGVSERFVYWCNEIFKLKSVVQVVYVVGQIRFPTLSKEHLRKCPYLSRKRAESRHSSKS